MNAGDLSYLVELREYRDGAWVTIGSRFAAMEYLPGIVFSFLAAKAAGAAFTVREFDITRENALAVDGQHYMITDVVPADKRYAKITAAAVPVTVCQLQRPTTKGLDEKNRPIPGDPETMDFDAILSEKYVGWQQQRPQAELERGVILTTPKTIRLAPGDLVAAGGEKYAVRECHTMNQWQNDYEITWLGEA